MQVIRNILRFVLCILLQALLFNRLQFMGVFHPYIYILCLLALPVHIPRPVELLLGAATGLLMDVFCSSQGVHMAACSLISFLRPLLIRLLVQDSERISQDISSFSLGHGEYIKLICILIPIHHVLVFILDAWSLSHPLYLLAKIVCSTVVTILLLLWWDAMVIRKQQKGIDR